MPTFKADEEIKDDETSEEKPKEGSETSDSSTETDGGETKGEDNEPKVPLSRLRQERQAREKAERELTESRSRSETTRSQSDEDKGRSDEKSRLRGILSDIQEEERFEQEKAERQLQSKLDDLKLADPKLDEKALLGIMERYGVLDPDKAYQIYRDLGKNKTGESTEKPKSPEGSRTTDEVRSEHQKNFGHPRSNLEIREDIRRESGT